MLQRRKNLRLKQITSFTDIGEVFESLVSKAIILLLPEQSGYFSYAYNICQYVKLGENLKNWNLRFESLVSEEVTETDDGVGNLKCTFESLVSEEVTETQKCGMVQCIMFESLVSEEVTETMGTDGRV